MNRLKTLAASLILTLPLAAATAIAAPASDARQALDNIAAAGHYAPYELEFRHGHWTAEGTTPEGLRVDLLVDPGTGAVHVFDTRGSGAISAAQVRDLLTAAGYTRITDLEFDDGFWEAEAIDALGREIDLVLHPVTGAILNAPADPAGGTPLTATEVLQTLIDAGYSSVTDLDYDDDGHWEADAVNSRGERVELRIEPYTGAVLREELDD